MDVSIIILTRNQPELLPRAVESYLREIEVEGVAGDVILIDNASIEIDRGLCLT